MMTEQSVASVRASVMIYDDQNKKWEPSGESAQPGLAKVQVFQHVQLNSYRIVGRKLSDHEVVINCAIVRGLKYNQATPTFHQWRDQRQVYGLNFTSPSDAQLFATAIMRAIDVANALAGEINMQQHSPAGGPASGAPLSYRHDCSQPANQSLQNGHATPPKDGTVTCAPSPGGGHHRPSLSVSSQDGGQLRIGDGPSPQHDIYGQADYARHQRKSSQSMSQNAAGNVIYTTIGPPCIDDGPAFSNCDSNDCRLNSAPGGMRKELGLIDITSHNNEYDISPLRSVAPSASSANSTPHPSASVLGFSQQSQAGQLAPVTGGPAPPPPPPPLRGAPLKLNVCGLVGGSPVSASAQKVQGVTNGDCYDTIPSLSAPVAPFSSPNFAQALASARLKKTPKPDEPSNRNSRTGSIGSTDSSSGISSGSGNSVGSGNPAKFGDMMSEMAATLAKRRALLNNGSCQDGSDSPQLSKVSEKEMKKPWDRSAKNGSDATESPKTHRKIPSVSSIHSQDEGISLTTAGAGFQHRGSLPNNGAINQQSISRSAAPSGSTPSLPGVSSQTDSITPEMLEIWKTEIVTEVRTELSKFKQDILEAVRLELNRR